MALLSKEQILSAKDSKHKDIDVPEWGGKVRVSVMSGVARDQFESLVLADEDNGNRRAKYLSACIVDDNGDLMFTDKEVEALGRKSAKALDRLFDVALELNGITEDSVEEAEKN